jgi:DNA-binding SARP family transcriptional activator
MFKRIALMTALALGLMSASASAQECQIEDRACVLKQLEASAGNIDRQAWRDQTYRELSKTYASDNDIDKAIELLEQITSSDTKALTIRGIGMAAADNNLTQAQYDTVFSKLRIAAEKIEHPPSYAIALTYIAMGQAFAGDNDGAWATAADMENDALRHKAYGETAEIQAEKTDFSAAMKSISLIESEAYRNKAYGHVSKILADHGKLQEAYEAGEAITNPYKKAVAFQYILDIQKPRDKDREDNK